MKLKYNFKNIKNIEDFLNEIGVNVEIEENGDKIKLWNFYAEEPDTFKDFDELNEYANERLNNLIENDICQETIDELIEEFAESVE